MDCPHAGACQVFNGGSDFNEPVRRCLDRLSDAKWANSDILLVSGGVSSSKVTHVFSSKVKPGQMGSAAED
eukprot:scaffold15807_cov20-Tisochrysis_lutea.AAC.6